MLSHGRLGAVELMVLVHAVMAAYAALHLGTAQMIPTTALKLWAASWHMADVTLHPHPHLPVISASQSAGRAVGPAMVTVVALQRNVARQLGGALTALTTVGLAVSVIMAGARECQPSKVYCQCRQCMTH